MVPITGNFQSETTLNPLALQALMAAYEAGWADPKKIGQASTRAALLKNSAIESLANNLRVSADQIEISGEVGLGYYLALAGLLSPEKHLYYGAGDRSGALATARSHLGSATEIPLRKNGELNFSKIIFEKNSVLSLQLANGETGAINDLAQQPNLASLPIDLLVAVDATASGTRVGLPEKWSSALFDSRSWAGPAGLAILAIASAKDWRNPLPHLSAVRRTYATYALPILIASAVALENFQASDENLRTFNKKIRDEVTSALPNSIIAGDLNRSLPNLISFIFPGCQGEELLRALSRRGITVDSGSACTAMNLQPSHVLAQMGLATDGNIRISLHSEISAHEVELLITALVDEVQSAQQR